MNLSETVIPGINHMAHHAFHPEKRGALKIEDLRLSVYFNS
jgi:hypothetical protein